MCSDELIANLFRISQTKQKLKNDNVQGENNCNITHYEIGKMLLRKMVVRCLRRWKGLIKV